MTFRTEPVRPSRSVKTMAFVEYKNGRGEYRKIDIPIYPRPGFDFRAFRKANDISLRDAAKRLGVSAATVSGLERGSLRPVDGWDEIVERLRNEH